MKLLLSVNLYLKCVILSYVIYKTLNRWYKCSDKCARRLHYPLFGKSGFCLISILSKKDFSLKLFTSFKNGFGLGIQR